MERADKYLKVPSFAPVFSIYDRDYIKIVPLNLCERRCVVYKARNSTRLYVRKFHNFFVCVLFLK